MRPVNRRHLSSETGARRSDRPVAQAPGSSKRQRLPNAGPGIALRSRHPSRAYPLKECPALGREARSQHVVGCARRSRPGWRSSVTPAERLRLEKPAPGRCSPGIGGKRESASIGRSVATPRGKRLATNSPFGQRTRWRGRGGGAVTGIPRTSWRFESPNAREEERL